MDKHVRAPSKPACQWLPDDFATLTTLCERADRLEGYTTTPPWRDIPGGLPAMSLAHLFEQFTDTGWTRLLTEVQAHPIYRQIAVDVPRVVSLKGDSPFDPLRRIQVIAKIMASPTHRKRRKASSRPDRRRKAELRAIRRLQHLTNSSLRKRTLAEWAAQDMKRSPVAFGKIAHLSVWWLAFDLWTDAHTADVRLLLSAARLIDPTGCDDSTAARYIKHAQKLIPKRPRAIRPMPSSPVAPIPGLLG